MSKARPPCCLHKMEVQVVPFHPAVSGQHSTQCKPDRLYMEFCNNWIHESEETGDFPTWQASYF
jgi:hypothetical protein